MATDRLEFGERQPFSQTTTSPFVCLALLDDTFPPLLSDASSACSNNSLSSRVIRSLPLIIAMCPIIRLYNRSSNTSVSF